MLLSRIEPEKMIVFKAVLESAAAEHVPIALIGAFARDVFLVGIHNISPTRKTMDVDWAVKVKDWTHYKRLRNNLVLEKNFKEAPEKNHPERLVDSSGNCVDILPFGGVEDVSKSSITWAEDDSQMSMLGFEEAFQSAVELTVSDGTGILAVPVVGLAGIVLLKIIAWTDRESNLRARRKHVKDIHTIISHYTRISSDRLKTGADSDLAEMYPDAILTGARLLGRDLRRLCHNETKTALDKLFKRQSEGKGECLFNKDFRDHCQGSYTKAKALVQALYMGFLEGNK